MSYQYSNNNFAYSSPTTTTKNASNNKTLASGRAYESSLFPSMASASGNKYGQYPSTTTSRGYKSNELPWSSSLASSSRYPVVATKSLGGSASGAGNIFLSKISRPSDRVTSTTISGRSLFDYPAPRTALNTPTSRIYDGQLRRTVTTKYTHNRYEPSNRQPTSTATAATATTRQQQSTKVAPKQNSASKSPSKSSGISSTSGSSQSSSSLTKPFRSSSLKLRASYTSILDQLTSTTLAKLKLGGNSGSSRTPTNSVTHNRITNTRCPALAIVPDEPEAEENASRLNGGDGHKLSESAASPGSSSSGLSSAGLTSGVSPTLSSSCYSTNSPTSSSNLTQPVTTSQYKLHISSNEDDSANISHEDPESGIDEQDTLVSFTVAKQTINESSDDETMDAIQVSKDNLIKTRAILAELETFDDESTSKLSYSIETSSIDDDDDESDHDESNSNLSHQEHPIIQSQLINESELILKPSKTTYPAAFDGQEYVDNLDTDASKVCCFFLEFTHDVLSRSILVCLPLFFSTLPSLSAAEPVNYVGILVTCKLVFVCRPIGDRFSLPSCPSQ